MEPSLGTDAAYSTAAPEFDERPLRNMSEVRHFFRTNSTPIFFVGATPFNLLGLDRWVRNFSYICYYDAWDGAHPRMFTPKRKPFEEFESGEAINNWLLKSPETRQYIRRHTPRGARPKIALVFFNEQTEQICRDLGYDLILPPAALREHLDSKIVTTKLGNQAGAPSVPNILTKLASYKTLMNRAEKAGLGKELVVQTPYGDSGKTTFFISSEEDWKKHEKEIVGQDIKVMKRINNRPVAVEAVLTSSGTVVGPFMTELAGYAELTPYRGGWCGNEMFPTVLEGEQRRKASELVRRLGDRLGKEGYRGFFEVDLLIDTDSEEVYLGELNPRISGASAITNVTAGAYADVPLFLFHLLEFLDVEIDLDVDEINERWERLASADLWSQMIIKETSPIVEQLLAAPRTGQYYFDDNGVLVFRRAALDWHQLQNENEAFFLRVYGPGDYRWKGADLGILVTKGRLQVASKDNKTALTIRAQDFINAMRAEFAGVPLGLPENPKEVTSEIV
ncbi:biotin carboxylase [Neomicrococcus aestuarii]|uniref:Biotin carboxylase n=2 Tax=Neomicrococcus aestuarii TaxID=556325 RepID=A0A7W8TTG1_9MICC|nr:biotin carboxylase [Neomicrococcus aestuarii]MBB5512483.1 biotin carboxylase [Neomicrococcus aestuarii]